MPLAQQKFTLDEYLAWEDQQPERNEFHRGEVFAMTGGRRTRGRVMLNLARRLAERLDGSPCQVFADSMKIQIADDTVLYPDVFVTCDKADLATDMIFRAPTLVIEVLSPSTQAYNRSQKFALYRRLASLQEYTLIDPETRRVEGFRRNAADQWVLYDMSQDEAMACASIACSVPMAQIFDGMDPAA